jgi:hypothetical protein
MTLYNAFYKNDHTNVIFCDVPREDIWKSLPPGTRIHVDANSTMGRVDGGDDFEHAYFDLCGRIIVVQRLKSV